MKYLLILLLGSLMVSCHLDHIPPQNIPGYAPVYATQLAANTISIETSRATTNAGKIYAYGNYLFQVEQNQGIHIIDNSNPQQAKKIGFLEIPTCTELAIKSNFLYTNNLNDLVVFDLSNISSPQLVKRIANAFPAISQSYPPFPGVYFECPDPSKGIVIGWEEKLLTEPKCRR
jgi:hypothetical protein